MSVRIKICGLTTEEDVAACVEAGVDAIGFNLWPKSKRYVSPARAAQLARLVPASILTVGVVVEGLPDETARQLAIAGLGAVQLHGDQDPEAFEVVDAGLIQVIRVRDEASLEVRVPNAVSLVLLDAHVDGFGGAGARFDWALVEKAKAKLARPILLAGGLTPDNVAEAIERARPWGVDVASGVESRPGRKDPARLRAFIAAVRDSA